MIKDKNSEKRYEYNLKIRDIEQQSEELRYQERQLEQALGEFNHTMAQSFHRLIEIEDELTRRSGRNTLYNEIEQKRRHILRLVENQQEEQAVQFRKVQQQLEDKREYFIKERNQLPWD
ncbi:MULTISPECIES: hypothetical protein [Enterococcus]|uniref:hypothetical protein n=1 Tax=Enterococcus TaxID=1350 RepID=UPI000709FAA6|nr:MULTISPECIES: hypothetical protein [Enterococcus]KXF71668.1 hypothetical protein AQ486_03540 [Enterococcus faecalis]KXF73969.1 hypothetical protein AQ487_03890 [Enterococcus faecalis]MBC2812584.1 hypothetical protein [Enterococcus faecalis]MBC2816484.1 hypothetical protein [Enterococcus faecalis]MBC2819497.1 hypothetical protein [Enterococcus faecalis]